MKVKVTQLCPALCGLYTVHGILQARILEWVAFPFYRGSSIEPGRPALKADSSPAEPSGKPQTTAHSTELRWCPATILHSQPAPGFHLDQEGPREEETAAHSSTLAWEIPRAEEPGGPQGTGAQSVGPDRADSARHTAGSRVSEAAPQHVQRAGFCPRVLSSQVTPALRHHPPTQPDGGDLFICAFVRLAPTPATHAAPPTSEAPPPRRVSCGVSPADRLHS